MALPLRLELYTPADDDRPVFVSGSFCDWHPADERFQLQRTGSGTYVYEFPDDLPLPDIIDYKYTKGGWEHVELDASGEGVLNRQVHSESRCRYDTVAHWRWFGMPYNPAFLPRIEAVTESVNVLKMSRVRRVNVLLPYDYDQTGRRYPVLYLHDGQNLFGGGAGYGSWEIDQKMALLAARHRHEVILVSIDHGEADRISEFLVHPVPFGPGRRTTPQGRRYLNYIYDALKPLIDRNYRTLPDVEHTGIGGSSLGGLISLHAGLMHPNLFSRLLIFSPSLWAAPELRNDIDRFQPVTALRVYVYGGERESRFMLSAVHDLENALLRRKRYGDYPVDINLSTNPEGTHQEIHWSREFPKAVEWLFYE